MRKTIKLGRLAFVGLFVSGMLVACGTEVTPTKVETTAEAEATEEVVEEAPAEPTVFKVGDTVNLGGMEITIKSASFVEPSEYTAPEAGKVLQMEVSATNKQEEKDFFSDIDFNLYDSEGNALEKYFGLDVMDVSGDVHPGKTISGVLTFDVPESASYELIYEPFSFDDKVATWEIVPQ